MYNVPYAHELPYIQEGLRRYPGLWLTLSALDHAVEVEAVGALDSGAEVSLFDGTLARMLEIDLFAGETQRFLSATCVGVDAYLHPVLVEVPNVGAAVIPIAFSTGPLLRNLLGRDFFAYFKIGFQERLGVVNLLFESDD